MLGAIAGDIIGADHEIIEIKSDYDFSLFSNDAHFTVDNVLTVVNLFIISFSN